MIRELNVAREEMFRRSMSEFIVYFLLEDVIPFFSFFFLLIFTYDVSMMCVENEFSGEGNIKFVGKLSVRK